MLRGALAGEEATARQVNAEPWEPMRGMVKRQCPAAKLVRCQGGQLGTTLSGLPRVGDPAGP